MQRVLTLYSTTIGKKIVMAVTGIVLVGFVIGHMIGPEFGKRLAHRAVHRPLTAPGGVG